MQQQLLDLNALNVKEPAASLSPKVWSRASVPGTWEGEGWQLSQGVTLVVASSPGWSNEAAVRE